MLHEPAPQDETIDQATSYKAALGVKLFFVYAVVYAGFVAIGLTAIEKYELIVFSGLNLAVVYGFGLILFALILALIYDGMCSRREALLNNQEQDGEN